MHSMPFAEIRKPWSNSVKECLIHYYRDKDTNEIVIGYGIYRLMEWVGRFFPLKRIITCSRICMR